MSLLQMSVAGAVMIAAIIVLRTLMKNRVPKMTFSVLWDIVVVRLLLPFSVPSRFSVYALWAGNTASDPTNSAAVALPFVSAELVGEAAPVVSKVSLWSVVWLMGTLLCVVWFGVVYCKCRHEFQMSLPVDNEQVRQWLRAHPLRRTLEIRQSDRISAPLTFGVWHPIILMPAKTDWESESLSYVLEHEFVHIQRFDALRNSSLPLPPAFTGLIPRCG